MNESLSELPIDPILGDLRATLAPAHVLEACRDGLTRAPMAQRCDWRDARVIEALYTPGSELRIAYALLCDPQTPDERVWPDAQIVYLAAPRRASKSARGETLHIDGNEFEAYRFPNDRRLRSVRRFQSRADAVAHWQRWIDDGAADFEIAPNTMQRRLVRYVPEQKWIIRLRAEGVDPANGQTSTRRIAVLAGSPRQCELVRNRHRALAAWTRSAGVPFTIPDVVGESTEGDLIGLEWLRGDSLLSTLFTSPEGVLFRIAEALHAFHGMPSAFLDAGDEVDVAVDVQAAVHDLCTARPEYRTALCELEHECLQTLEQLARVQPTVLHNDFHWNQVTIKPSRLALLDLDCVCLGDPLIDVANFAAQLAVLGHRPELEVKRGVATKWSATFLEAWAQTTGKDLEPNRMRIYTTASLLRLARGMMRHLRPGWRELAGVCIELAQAGLHAREVRA